MTNRWLSQQTEHRESDEINEECHSPGVPGVHHRLKEGDTAHLPVVAEGDRSHKQLCVEVVEIGVRQDPGLALLCKGGRVVLGGKLGGFEGPGENHDPENEQGGNENPHNSHPGNELWDAWHARVSGFDGAAESERNTFFYPARKKAGR